MLDAERVNSISFFSTIETVVAQLYPNWFLYITNSNSLDSDLKHQSGIENNAVSPAVFVYTLPNIVIGEISIKYKWKSEGVFFIDEEIDYLVRNPEDYFELF